VAIVAIVVIAAPVSTISVAVARFVGPAILVIPEMSSVGAIFAVLGAIAITIFHSALVGFVIAPASILVAAIAVSAVAVILVMLRLILRNLPNRGQTQGACQS
jgi:hypothetical protein